MHDDIKNVWWFCTPPLSEQSRVTLSLGFSKGTRFCDGQRRSTDIRNISSILSAGNLPNFHSSDAGTTQVATTNRGSTDSSDGSVKGKGRNSSLHLAAFKVHRFIQIGKLAARIELLKLLKWMSDVSPKRTYKIPLS